MSDFGAPIGCHWFRTRTNKNEPAKTSVSCWENAVYIRRRFLTTDNDCLGKVVKKFRDYNLVQEEISFKYDSLKVINGIIDYVFQDKNNSNQP